MEKVNDDNTPEVKITQSLPNATATLVLGILSIVSCWCYGFLGVILGIVALAISSKSVKLYKEDPTKWSDYGNLNAGRITAIIGLSLSAILVIFVIIYLVVFGLAAFSVNEMWNEFY